MKVYIDPDTNNMVVVLESDADTMDIMRWRDKSGSKIIIATAAEIVNNLSD